MDVFTKDEAMLAVVWYIAHMNGVTDKEKNIIATALIPMEKISGAAEEKARAKWDFLAGRDPRIIDDLAVLAARHLSIEERVRILAWGLIVAGGSKETEGAEKLEVDIIIDLALRFRVETSDIILKARAIAMQMRKELKG
ncbi:MAG: hypothetical protein AABZ39_05215 [Spirochaetota bacterium]